VTELGQALDDPERLSALRAADLGGEVSLEALQRISRLVARLLRVDTALVNLVDGERQTTITGTSANPRFGVTGSTPLTNSFCQHVVRDGETFAVTDSREDDRLDGNLGVTEDHVIAYLGVPLRSPDGYVLGALCAIDDQPREPRATPCCVPSARAGSR
jgi:GAF domain-containing protein